MNKKITLVIDGVADRAISSLGGTPLEAAKTPNLDFLAKKSQLGCVRNIPQGMEVGSAVANLSLLGYDPAQYQGRAVVEAAGSGMTTNDNNLYVRANFVTLDGDSYETSKIKSYSAYEVESEIAEPLNAILQDKVFKAPFKLHYAGSFRNILEVEGGASMYPLEFAPAHDIIAQPIMDYVNYSGREKQFFEMQKQAYEELRGNGSNVHGIWLWGASIPPKISGRTQGRVVLAETILLKGISKIAGIDIKSIDDSLPFEEFLELKRRAALDAINGGTEDVYLHIQECDDLSHELESEKKMKAVEKIDAMIGRLIAEIEGNYSLIVVSDHYTFSDTGAHGDEPAPFMLYKSNERVDGGQRYTEQNCRNAKMNINTPELLEKM